MLSQAMVRATSRKSTAGRADASGLERGSVMKRGRRRPALRVPQMLPHTHAARTSMTSSIWRVQSRSILSPGPVSCRGLGVFLPKLTVYVLAQCPPSIPVLLGRDGRRRRPPRPPQCGAFPVHIGSSPMGAGGIRPVSKREQRARLRALPQERLRSGVREAPLRVNLVTCRGAYWRAASPAEPRRASPSAPAATAG
jgi:hypothetical protein